ncbi:IS1096 element passenger TnpR family protein [Corynebacterium aquatimens]|uniref:Plasmid pRiA4b Orf3-like domain-containing protein n=1 Tax=Corynebacterium aquatimens TaxID=1190508 RepID=A0A931E2T4_9CORY|nr:hypothetical protein [Corynebacterium aquatimens]MBG6122751.1 hypothetical protein [Corynebacterium aquatimens]
MIVSVLMTIEGSRPEISRLVNLEGTTDLSELSPIIDAAFGFSGVAKHFYMANVGGKNQVYSSWPSTGELDEEHVTIADMPPMTYVYDPSANWNVHIERFGTAEVEGPTPLLVDALGPDVIEACGGPDMMTQFHTEARRLAAGHSPNLKVSPLLLSFMPVMSPERLIQRLSAADHPSISERIAFTAEDLMLDGSGELEANPHSEEIADKFEEFMESRPDLQNILSLDPNPERNPTLIAAISEFFAEEIDEDNPEFLLSEPFDQINDHCRALLVHFTVPRKLTQEGNLRAADVRALAEPLGLPIPSSRPREISVRPILELRLFFESLGHLINDNQQVILSPRGRTALVEGDLMLQQIFDHLPGYFGLDVWDEVLEWLGFETEVLIDPEVVTMPDDPEFIIDLFIGLGVLTPTSTRHRMEATPSGRLFIEEFFDDSAL